MQIGVFVFQTDASADPAVLAKRAEELGFASYWVPEHPIIPVRYTSRYPGSADGIIPDAYGRIADPFVALARASAVTKTITLGTGICLIPERNPLLLAKEVATLDRYSGGRFIFGIGAGWLKEETEIMGGDFAHRWTQTKDAIMAMKELWTKDEAEYHGKYYDFPAVRSFPKPVQKPHPPIYLGGTAKNVFRRVAEWGDGWMPVRATAEEIKKGRATLDELAKQAGRDPKSIAVLAFGFPGRFRTREEIDDLARAGVNHVTIWITTDGEGAVAEMEELARTVLK
ncbi:MAG: LLM class F420-dependent oxidoreductase [Thermodesulfobacteriota bacterium]|jgi:probable F420-dependent oxidoreductase